MAENWQTGGFGLYVHWPFCEAKCPYCDFNSHVVRKVDQTRWAKALVSEIRRHARLLPDRVLSAIFFGGGTPSLMAPDTVAAVLAAARDGWVWANDIEVSLEANPRSVDALRFDGYAAAGVNRVSLGVQSLRADDLRRLGRLHDAEEARAAFAIARAAFDRVSFDLIYARQAQSEEDWAGELSEALAMAVDHLSLYQLTLEPGTAFWDRAASGGLAGLPTEDGAADLYALTQDLCRSAGFPAYEVSNHARPGAESRHNLVYWRYGDWVGVGPGAHGRYSQGKTRTATAAWSQPVRWLDAAESGDGTETRTVLRDDDQAAEYLMMGLRLTEGIDIDRLAQWTDGAAILRRVDALCEDGFMWRKDLRVGATEAGRLLLNRLVLDLAPDPVS